MVNRVLMWAAASPRLQRQVTENPIARRAAHLFVAGQRLDEALDVAAALNSQRIGGIPDLLGEGSLICPARATPSRTTCRHRLPLPAHGGAHAVPASGRAAQSTARPSGAGDA